MIRKHHIATFDNHPPIKLWAEFETQESADNARYVSDFEHGCVWKSGQQWGWHEINYYVCKSGKRIYWASFNSGESYNGREPRTRYTFLKTIADIRDYLANIGPEEWHRISHKVDPSVIVDSDLL